jgi:hypothetical protein
LARACSVVNIHLILARSASTFLPCGRLSDEAGIIVGAPVETLAYEDTDLDLDHVEPAGMLWGVMELQPLQQPRSLMGGKA